ncbi:hypothetical protein BR93DRAFT_972884 [Coniochaeta sp. PMI_546]|nr:hypothetical protein BR93DRAFT_972884 [Coniochaeta sp. PMI_546]
MAASVLTLDERYFRGRLTGDSMWIFEKDQRRSRYTYLDWPHLGAGYALKAKEYFAQPSPPAPVTRIVYRVPSHLTLQYLGPAAAQYQFRRVVVPRVLVTGTRIWKDSMMIFYNMKYRWRLQYTAIYHAVLPGLAHPVAVFEKDTLLFDKSDDDLDGVSDDERDHLPRHIDRLQYPSDILAGLGRLIYTEELPQPALGSPD